MNREQKKEVAKIIRSLKNADKFIKKRLSQSRWVWEAMHKRTHDNQFRLLKIIAEQNNEIARLKANQQTSGS